MKSRWIFILGILGAACYAPGAQAQDAFEKGLRFYERGEFKYAAQEFEQCLHEGRTSSAVYYNLGNAYFKQGIKGKALWAYERSLLLDPRDADARWNLGIVRKGLQDRQPERDVFFLTQGIVKFLEPIRTNELAFFFSVIVFCLGLGIFAAAFSPSARLFLRKAVMLLGLLVLGSGLLLGLRWQVTRFHAGIVGDTEVYVRYGPNLDATRAFLLHEGSKVILLKSQGDWIFIEFAQGQRGWVERSSILKI